MRILAILLVLGTGLTTLAGTGPASDSTPDGMPSIEPLNVDSAKIGSMVDFLMALQEKDDAQAAELLLKVLKYDPNAEMPLLLLLKKCSTPEILKKIEPGLIQLARTNPSALKLNLAVLLFGKTHTPAKELADMGLAAVQTVQTPEKLSQPDQIVLAKLAEVAAGFLVQEKRYGDAEQIFEKLIQSEAIRRDIQFIQAAAGFYGMVLESGRLNEEQLKLYRERREQLLQLTEKYFKAPKTLSLILQTAMVYQNLGAYPQAIRLIRFQLLKMPKNQVLQERLGNLLFISGDIDEALRVRRELAQRYPEIRNYQNAYAETLLHSGKINDAIAELETMSKAQPTDPYLRYMLGLAYYYGGRYREAIDFLKEFKNYSALRILVGSYSNLGDYDEALRLLDATAKSPRKEFSPDIDFYFMYLNIGEKSKRPELVRKYAEIIKEKFGWDSAETANAIGYTYAEVGIELPLAEKLIRHALEKDPGNMAILDSMAWVLYRRGDLKGARNYIEQSIRATGNEPDPVIADHAGDIYAAMHHYVRAVRYWEKALRSGGNNIDPDKIRRKIKAAEDELAFE